MPLKLSSSLTIMALTDSMCPLSLGELGGRTNSRRPICLQAVSKVTRNSEAPSTCICSMLMSLLIWRSRSAALTALGDV